VGCDGRVSASNRNARSRIAEYFLFLVFHPCFENGTKVSPIHLDEWAEWAPVSREAEGKYPRKLTAGARIPRPLPGQ
jgi:hypothetical protein